MTDVTYADKTITVKKGTNSATPLQLTGLVDGASYDGASGKLTFTTNGGTPIEINLPVEQFLAAAAYDAETHILSLTMTDNTKFDVDLGDLIDVYEAGETESISVSVSGGTITASLKVSAEAARTSFRSGVTGHMFRRSAGRLWKAHDAELQTEAWNKVSGADRPRK